MLVVVTVSAVQHARRVPLLVAELAVVAAEVTGYIYYLLSTLYYLLSTLYPAIYCRYDSPHARVVSESVAVWSALAVDLESEPLGVSVGFLQHEEGCYGVMTVIHSPAPAPTPV